MHSTSHTLAHRPPLAARTRVRWQPYSSTASSSRSSPIASTSTAPTSIVSSPASSVKSSGSRRPSISSNPAPIDAQARDPSKSRYVIGLVDQAVKSLSEIWHPQDIPSVFVTSSRVNVTLQSSKCKPSTTAASASIAQQLIAHKGHLNTQLPSPESPNTRHSPFPSPSSKQHPSTSSDSCSETDSQNTLVPLKGFVHEVLRRSRTSGTVLQTALCYLEAIRPKVPVLVQKEKSGEGVQGETSGESRIVMADSLSEDTDAMQTETDHLVDTERCPSPASQFEDASQMSDVQSQEYIQTATPISGLDPLAANQNFSSSDAPPASKKHSKAPSTPLPSLPPLPSPLLCPRRAFLAALILASKFTQDRCYSNKAWAKLSGLPPREIGRCERALGDALDWRLWVGKTPISPTAASGRAVGRSRSEGDLFPPKVPPAPVPRRSLAELGALAPSTIATAFSNISCTDRSSVNLASGAIVVPRTSAGLRRASTVPTQGFLAPKGTGTPWPLMDTSGSAGATSETPASHDQELSWRGWSDSSQASSSSSSSPPTPSLSFSPSSTESSSNSDGDRTIQISSFIDVPLRPKSGGKTITLDPSTLAGHFPPFFGASCGSSAFGDHTSSHLSFSHGCPVSIPSMESLQFIDPMYSY